MNDDDPKVSHLADRRPKTAIADEESLVQRIAEVMDTRLAQHFKEQNEALRTGLSRLIKELDGVRSGTADYAFGKVAHPDCEADIPTVAVDAAIHYPHSGADIGAMLGLTATEVGTLLGARGLGWADDPRYQECDRYKPGRTRFWHVDVPRKLEDVLTNPPQEHVQRADKRIKAIFRKFRRARGLAQIFPWEERSSR